MSGGDKGVASASQSSRLITQSYHKLRRVIDGLLVLPQGKRRRVVRVGKWFRGEYPRPRRRGVSAGMTVPTTAEATLVADNSVTVKGSTASRKHPQLVRSCWSSGRLGARTYQSGERIQRCPRQCPRGQPLLSHNQLLPHQRSLWIVATGVLPCAAQFLHAPMG